VSLFPTFVVSPRFSSDPSAPRQTTVLTGKTTSLEITIREGLDICVHKCLRRIRYPGGYGKSEVGHVIDGIPDVRTG